MVETKDTDFRIDIGKDGIAVLTWDMPARSMNVITERVMGELGAFIDRLESDEALTGAIITSAKPAFCAGADIAMLLGAGKRYEEAARSDERAATAALFEDMRSFSNLLRRLETCGKPVVAALNGTALGGGLEIALACHHRICADDRAIKLGLPESKIGLLPGGGGTQRLPRLMGAGDSLKLMLRGGSLDPDRARASGMIDEVVAARSLLKSARAWVESSADPVQPWDKDGFRVPGGTPYSPSGMMTWIAGNALYRKQTLDNYPAQRAIMSCVFEGLQVPIDVGLRIEARYFTSLLRNPVAGNMIRTFFFSVQALAKGARRPGGIVKSRLRKIGVVGAGMMGAGIAYVSAAAGLDVVLLDRDKAAAEKGRALSEKLVRGRIKRGQASEADLKAVLARIEPGGDYGLLKGCDLVIEAVFEDRALKDEIIAKVQAVTGKSVVFASNTSTLPITGLAESSLDPERFIGIHFFSPVHKMGLVEIIRGERTGDEALAVALDYVRAIRKTPIVVNDARGFYASRVVATYIEEGHRMLDEGVPPAMIENAGRLAGMPVGPLALNDEVSLDLSHKIAAAAKADLGADYVATPRERIIEEMVVGRGRFGRKNAKGFYDYNEDGGKRLWPGLEELQPERLDPDTLDVSRLCDRFLAAQALETVRCLEENILEDVREADVGSVLGWGFAPFTGGTLSYIDTMGPARFLALCEDLKADHGARFEPPALLRDMAAGKETFYERYAPPPARAAE